MNELWIKFTRLYRLLAKKYHPDTYPDKQKAHEIMIFLNQIYDETRKVYEYEQL